ncbi:MAG TPA: sigma-70 family RNA polymerase sigma factor [Candidatus Nanopelagicales bacterium]
METTDDDLGARLAAAASGDRASWDHIVDRFANLVWSVARSYRLSSDDAADVVQTTWLRLLDNLDRIEDAQRLGSWLATTARNESLHSLRRSKREPAVDLVEIMTSVADGGAALDADLLRAERDVALWELFERLSDNCRRLLRVMIATPAPSYAEVSEALGMPIGSIGPTRARCLASLRTLAVDADLAPDLG